ncbi:MAG: lysophospholipase [Candidatus Pacebacteria bacterium]|nr:lysophospholipase [Candidatus Paceibacterota bacterium]
MKPGKSDNAQTEPQRLGNSRRRAASSDQPNVERWEYSSPVDGRRDWALVRDGHDTTGRWVVVLHGHGATGDQIFTQEYLKQREREIAELGLGLLCPNLRGNAWMCPAAVDDLRFLLNLVRERRGASQFVFCSGSMGGTGNLIYAIRHPEDVAGVVALCPATDIGGYCEWAARSDLPVLQEIVAAIESSYGRERTMRQKEYAANSVVAHASRLTMPLAIIHGDADPIIPVSQSRNLVRRLREQNMQVWYKEIPGGDHNAPIPEFGAALLTVLDKIPRQERA